MLREIKEGDSSLQSLIEQIFETYLTDKFEFYRPDNDNRSISRFASFDLIVKQLPTQILVGANLDKTRYKVKGSIGQANITSTPHVCVLDLEITKSPSDGYYVAYLFDANMDKVYLTLVQSWTPYGNRFGVKEGKERIRETTQYIQAHLRTKADFSLLPIQLNGDNIWGDKYEMGTIMSKRYDRGNIPDDIELLNDLRNVMSAYSELKGWIGKRIMDIEAEADQFQQKAATIAKSKNNSTQSLDKTIRGLMQLPTKADFKSEFNGYYTIDVKQGKQTVNKKHGIVVEILAKKLKEVGFEAKNKRQDLFIVDEERKYAEIYEVKTGTDFQSIATAVGQLVFYGMSFKLNGYDTALRLVCRLEEEITEVESYLADFNIKVIRFHWDGPEPKFDNLISES